jgi:hypothetical protein
LVLSLGGDPLMYPVNALIWLLAIVAVVLIVLLVVGVIH